MTAVPRYRNPSSAAILSAGFRPFFLGAAVWAALAVPRWIGAYAAGLVLPSQLAPSIWHPHEMVYGFAAATVAGFLLTAVPNWTGRLPLQGGPLAVLVSLWVAGRIAVLISAAIGAPVAAGLDLAFPAAFLAVVAREVVAGRNWRNLPVVAALALLLAGNFLVHLEAVGLVDTAPLGIRIGIATLLMLIALVGGRIIPSFTRNWLAKTRPTVAAPKGEGPYDVAVMAIAGTALVSWMAAPEARATAWALAVGGIALLWRLARWQGMYTLSEPLLAILHLGYLWLALGMALLGLDGILGILPAGGALHALTVGAIGTMTLAVMTRASLGHTRRPLSAGVGTCTIYALVTVAAVLRVLAYFAGAQYALALWLSAGSWCAAFGLFAILYGRVLARPLIRDGAAPTI